jgi:DNA-binding response OmpR family regulator
MADVLIVEDDRVIGETLRDSLRGQGYRVRLVTSGSQAIDSLAAGNIDLALVDLGLPDLDGVELTRRLREAQPAAVIVILTARRDEIDVVVGLEAGADDYLMKPFRLAELLARLRAHLRRGPATAQRVRLVVGQLEVDEVARRATLGGADVELRAKEFDLLARLAMGVGEAVSRETLMSDVWDANWFGSTKTLDVHIAALRRRLVEVAESVGCPPPAITTLRGHGYRLEMPTGGPGAGGR